MLKKIFALTLSTFISFCSFSYTKPITDTTKPQPSTLRTIVIDAGHGLPDPGAQGKYSNESDITLAIAQQVGARLKQVLPECNILFTRTDANLPNGLTDKNKANRYRAEFANQNRGDLFIAIHVNSAAARYERKIEGYKEETYYTYTGKGSKRKKVQKTRSVPIYKSYKLPCNVKGTETYIWAVNRNDQKKNAAHEEDEVFGEQGDSTYNYFDDPQAKILASLRTKKYFDKSLMAANYVEEEFRKIGRVSLGVKQRNNEGIWVLQATNMPAILVETGFICSTEEEDYLNSEKGQQEISYAVMRAVLRYKQTLDTGSLVPITTDSLPNSITAK